MAAVSLTSNMWTSINMDTYLTETCQKVLDQHAVLSGIAAKASVVVWGLAVFSSVALWVCAMLDQKKDCSEAKLLNA